MTTGGGPISPSLAMLIRAQPLFEGLDQRMLAKLIDQGRLVDFAPGDTLIHENMDNDQLFLITEGLAAVSSSGTPIGKLAAGELAGEISSAKISPPVATVRAETALQTLSFPASLITGIAATDAGFARRLRQIAFRRISGQPSGK